MYCGEIVEEGPTENVLHHPGHPYTKALLNCMPGKYVFSEYSEVLSLPSIPGVVPSLRDRPSGCVFRTRCPLAQEICLQKPPYVDLAGDQKSLCHFAQDVHL